jgi:translocation protein SEC62
VDYFKGKKFIESILENKNWPKKLPTVSDKATAILLAQELIKANIFHRSEKVKDKKGFLQISQRNVFEETGYYTWMYSGSMMWSNVLTGIVIALVVGFTLLPIWPEIMKRILWYVSVTILLTTLIFVFVRFIIFLVSWILGREFWIFPRLFDESLSFVESFKPIYTFEVAAPGQGYYRMGLMAILVYFCYWAYTQPTEFDGFLKAQKDFVDDLYSGNLLADVAHDHKINIDRSRKVPDLEDLLRQVKEDERIASEAANSADGADESSPSEEELEREKQETESSTKLDDLLEKDEKDL